MKRFTAMWSEILGWYVHDNEYPYSPAEIGHANEKECKTAAKNINEAWA